jgi:hypothetical protein
MAPRATAAQQEVEEEEIGQLETESGEDSGETVESETAPEDDAAQKAKAARLGKKLRRKAMLKEHPPAEP